MIKGLLIILFWITLYFITSISFAQTSTESGEIYNPKKVLPTPRPYDWCNEHGCGYGDQNPTWPPERKCGACAETHSTKTRIEASQTIPSPTFSAEVKGVQKTSELTKAIIKPTVKPIISPSPIASISATYPKQTIKPAEQKQLSTSEKIWNWILNLFKIQ